MAESLNQIRFICTNRQAAKSADSLGLDIGRTAATLRDCWQLRVTSGSKVRRLRHIPGIVHRLRLGGFRIVFSIIDATAFIHIVEVRSKVYEGDAFYSVLKRFYEATGTQAMVTPEILEELAYEELALTSSTVAYPEEDPEWKRSIGYFLRPKQQFFFNSVLPIDGTRPGRNPRLVIGYGPPGAGKTIVGIDLAIETVMDGHNVDILVPSRSLKKEYLSLLQNAGLPASETHEDAPGARVLRFEEYFGLRGGLDLESDRESRTLAWVRSRFEEPRRKARLGTLRGSLDIGKILERLPVLADTLLEDEEWWSTFEEWSRNVKDPMVEPIIPYIKLLGDMRPSLMDALDQIDGSELSTRASVATLPPVEAGQPARLLIVDEAQDMAPAEWRTLLSDAYIRFGETDQRLILLGDLRQRVNLVPFAWENIKIFAKSECGLLTDQVSELEVDQTSYRMKLEVARAADSVFDQKLRRKGKFRKQSTLDLDRLPSGGHVTVAVLDERSDWLKRSLDHSQVSHAAGGYLFVIHGREAVRPLRDRTDIVNYSIKEAKGLEADSIVVHLPFSNVCGNVQSSTIDHDDATEFYTALSRARDRVLLLVDQKHWALLSQASEAWEGAEVIEGQSLSLERLSGVVAGARIGLSTEEVIDARLGQLEAAAENSGLSAEEASVTVIEALRDLARHPDDDLAENLLKIGASLASVNPDAFEALRSWHKENRYTLTQAENVAFLVFFGELAVAAAFAGGKKGGREPRWDPEWLELIRDESPIQKFRADSGIDMRDLEWSDINIEAVVLREAIRSLSASSVGRKQAPANNLDRFFATGYLVAAEFAEPAADALARRRFAETVSRISDRMGDEELRIMRAVEDHRRKLSADFTVRLDRAADLLGGKGTH